MQFLLYIWAFKYLGIVKDIIKDPIINVWPVTKRWLLQDRHKRQFSNDISYFCFFIDQLIEDEVDFMDLFENFKFYFHNFFLMTHILMVHYD